jgi:hypothetical protein
MCSARQGRVKKRIEAKRRKTKKKKNPRRDRFER